jgi:hypothetical protein
MINVNRVADITITRARSPHLWPYALLVRVHPRFTFFLNLRVETRLMSPFHLFHNRLVWPRYEAPRTFAYLRAFVLDDQPHTDRSDDGLTLVCEVSICCTYCCTYSSCIEFTYFSGEWPIWLL